MAARDLYRRDGTARIGETNVNARVRPGNVRESRRLHATGNYSQRELARKLQVSHQAIDAIVRWETWTHVE